MGHSDSSNWLRVSSGELRCPGKSATSSKSTSAQLATRQTTVELRIDEGETAQKKTDGLTFMLNVLLTGVLYSNIPGQTQ